MKHTTGYNLPTMISNDCPSPPNNFSPDDRRTFVHRQARKWRFFSLGGGLLLAASFFMPAVQGCNSPVIPAKEWHDFFSRNYFSFSDLVGCFYMFGAAYLMGLLLALGAWTRLRVRPSLEKKASMMIAAFLLFAAGSGIVLCLIQLVSNTSSTSDHIGEMILIFICAVPIVYVLFTFRLDRSAYICRTFLAELIVFVWFSFWVIECLGGGGLIGLYLSFLATCVLLLATIAEAKIMARQSVWRTILQLLLCRFSYRTDLQRRCPGCDYDLFGLTEMRCPECGRPFTFKELGTSPIALGFMGETG
jgi:hypothetical protein